MSQEKIQRDYSLLPLQERVAILEEEGAILLYEKMGETASTAVFQIVRAFCPVPEALSRDGNPWGYASSFVGDNAEGWAHGYANFLRTVDPLNRTSVFRLVGPVFGEEGVVYSYKSR